jgi:hypothetical protein
MTYSIQGSSSSSSILSSIILANPGITINDILNSSATINNKTLSEIITSKSTLITRAELIAMSSQIKLVGFDPLYSLLSSDEKSFSPRLINYVESYDVSGVAKTLFYTEINSGLKVGDRVFIIGGNYCNDILIKKDKYKKGRDGYKIISIDYCKVVLDIDYTGVLPWNDSNDDDFMKVYYIRNKSEFIQASRQVTTRDGIFDYKFNYNQNSIAFFDQDYGPVSGWGKNGGAYSSPGFFVKNVPSKPWLNITPQITTGSFSVALSSTYYNNNRIKIMNETFTHNGKEFKLGYVYKWEVGPTQSSWEVDVTYLKPYLTKGNFRGGNFNGTWNTGLFGKQNGKIKWEGISSDWNGGTLLNTLWENGIMNSKFTLTQSYFSNFAASGNPYQKSNSDNNNGWGFNYIIDSEVESTTINSGNIIDSVLGTYSLSNTIVENHITSVTQSFPVTINKALIQSSTLNNSSLNSLELSNSRVLNSKLSMVKSVNSYLKDSVIKDSSITSDNVIKVIDYDEYISSETKGSGTFSSILGPGQKIYKFYITKESYNRLRNRDSFYLKGVVIDDNTKNIINFFDKKYKLTSWTEYIDFYSTVSWTPPVGVVSNQFYKRGIEHSAFLSTPEENSFRYTSVTDLTNYYTSCVDRNSKKNYSVDIIVSTIDINSNAFTGLDFLRLSQNGSSLSTSPTIYDIIPKIDISKTYIIDSDFESGIIETSDWNSGSHIDNNNDNNITILNTSGGTYNLSISATTSTIVATTSYSSLYPESDNYLSVGKVLFLNSVDYIENMVGSFSFTPNSGSGYTSSTSVGTTGSSTGLDLTVDIVAISGYITSVIINNKGYNYQAGDTLTILSGNSDCNISIVSTEEIATRIPEAYKVTSISSNSVSLKELLVGTSSQLSTFNPGGYFKTNNAQNRWGYLSNSKFYKSKIKSGFLRRSNIEGSLIEAVDYDSSDKDYTNLERAKNMVISDSLFSNKSNILSNSTYINSHFVLGSDIWNNGIVQNSVWNGSTFSSGTIKESRWVGGVMNGGAFYSSRTFNASPTSLIPYYSSENIRSYYKDGLTTVNISNDRWSWQNGVLNSVNTNRPTEFSKSDWENGVFNSGDFYDSKWYSGTFSTGIIGNSSISVEDTYMYSGVFLNPVVNNATLFAIDTSYYGLSNSTINWQNGNFNSGVFGSDIIQTTASNTAIWYNGKFNGGQFISNARWKNGSFNGGKFISGYGWTMSNSASQSQYTWEDGEFNDGEFGTADGLTNSTWYTGEFSNGSFKGRVWNDGIFKYGEFVGSSTYSAFGGTSSGNANNFVDSFSQSYYGLWRNGILTEIKDKFIKDKKTVTEIERSSIREYRISSNKASIKNAIWMSGTFSHLSGEMNNCVWLDGTFQNGTFNNSSFNPYVKRNGSLTQSFNLDDSCVWENGNFKGGDFHISVWKNGLFDIGDAYGMIWKNGTSNYMNAFNIFWENGLWKNGNWYGSSFEFNGEVTNDFDKQIMFRGMSWSGTASAHIWNIFDNTFLKPTLYSTALSSTPISDSSLNPTGIPRETGTMVSGVSIDVFPLPEVPTYPTSPALGVGGGRV